MLLDNSTGLDFNDAGVDLQGVDILWDIPQVVSLARVRYANGTRLEFSYCPLNAEADEIETFRAEIPHKAITLRGWPSDTLGCEHGDEYTTAYWIFE